VPRAPVTGPAGRGAPQDRSMWSCGLVGVDLRAVVRVMDGLRRERGRFFGAGPALLLLGASIARVIA
jgi:hypothetical protein